jgi:hypothetical protein
MLGVIEYLPFIGRRVHIYERSRFPSAEVIYRIKMNSWRQFKEFVESKFQIDRAASFFWELGSEGESERFNECIHLKNGITVYYTGYDSKAEIIYDYKSDLGARGKIIEKLKSLKSTRKEDEIGLLVRNHGALEVSFFKFHQYEQDVIPYMEEEVQAFFKRMVNDLNDGHQGGLYLLHGEPGTGKTSFIKKVLASVDRQAIFIPPSMAEHLDSPDLIGLLSDYAGSLIIIEDAEKVLMKREGDHSSAVSTILNLSDGFTADFLDVTILCTFNTEISDIDPALLRKGRLKGIQKFRKLRKDQIEKMIDDFGLKVNIEPKNMTLAEFWNYSSPDWRLSDRKVGFK